jgi:hypothetical protein
LTGQGNDVNTWVFPPPAVSPVELARQDHEVAVLALDLLNNDLRERVLAQDADISSLAGLRAAMRSIDHNLPGKVSDDAAEIKTLLSQMRSQAAQFNTLLTHEAVAKRKESHDEPTWNRTAPAVMNWNAPSPGRNTCFQCGAEGHFARDCPKRQRLNEPMPWWQPSNVGGRREPPTRSFPAAVDWSLSAPSHAKCLACGGEGHLARDCQKQQKPSNNSNKRACWQLKNGHCPYGDRCKFDHGIVEACRLFAKGQCSYGTECKYSHDQDTRGGTSREVCRNFAKYGQCKFGDRCFNSHEVAPPPRRAQQSAPGAKVEGAGNVHHDRAAMMSMDQGEDSGKPDDNSGNQQGVQ